jgi:hypothetical protein
VRRLKNPLALALGVCQNSIEYYGDNWGLPIIAFDKLDGSNLRFEYSQKRGFYKFGTRNMMIDERSEPFGFAINIFRDKYEKELTKIFKGKEYRNTLAFVCFAELIGAKSSFGQHDFINDTFDTVLFDIDQYKKGFVPPKQFIKDFGGTGIPKVVYTGNLNKEFVQKVKANEFGLSEGVICKGVTQTKKGSDNLFYCKIKTDNWFEELRSKYPERYKEELNEVKTEY